MEAVFLALIERLNSSVFVLILILMVAGFLLYSMGKWKHKLEAHDKKVDKLEGMAEKVITLTTKIDLIYQYTNPNVGVKPGSPLNLTTIGKEIITKLNANVILEKHKKSLIQSVEKLVPNNNAYDIQQVALKVAQTEFLNLLNEAELASVKQEAYERGLLIEDVMNIFGVLLRNVVLTAKGIPLAHVDRDNPNHP